MVKNSRENFGGKLKNRESLAQRIFAHLRYNNKTVQYRCLILWGLNFRGFLSMVI